MVSDQEIANGVENLLRHSDPNSFTSLNAVIQHLEAKLGLDLSQKAGFIRDQIEFLLRSHQPPPHLQQQQPPHQPQPQQPPHPQQVATPKDHFALQHHPQFHTNQIPHHFALQQQQQLQHHHHHQQVQHHHPQQRHHHHEELNFQLPLHPQHPNLQHPHHQHHLGHPPVQSRSHPQAQKNAAPDTPKESAPAKRRGGAGGLNKVCAVSPELQAIVGEPEMPRTEIVKQLWAYIRKNNLQDPSNKRKIICNDELRLVFETDCTDMFKMNKLLSKHITSLAPSKETGRDKKRVKVEDEGQVNVEDESQVKVEDENQVKVEDETEVKVEDESHGAVQSASDSTEAGSSLVIISDALANFFGYGGRAMLPSEALKRVLEYIEVNELKDPTDSMVILCDAKLQELFGCESISSMGVTEMVGRHLYRQES